MAKIVKLSDESKNTDYFPVSVTEAIYHKDSKGEVEVLSDVLNDIRDDVGDASQSINDIINGNTKVKASVAESLTDEAKEEIIDEASSQAVADIGDTLNTTYYTKNEIDERLQGVGKIGAANATAISALQTRVGTAEGGITTINGEITNLKTKDTSHDNSITAINTALYGTGNDRKFVTLTEFNPVKLNANDVPALVTWKQQVSEKTIIDDTLVSVFSAIADGEGNDIASTYAKTTDIPDTSGFALKTELINLTYSEDGTVTY